jgi:hypothetical protein
MPTLSSTIVKREVASPKDVERALARQAIHGGDLITNLLEIVNLSEERLVRTIAESLELDPAPTGELPRSGDGLLRLVPSDLARRHGFFPLVERGGALVVAVSEPLGDDAASDLEFSLGVRLLQQATTLVRVKQAIARDYGVPLDRRSARVLARLDGKPDPSPSVPPGPVVGKREPTVPPDALPELTRARPSAPSALDLRALAGGGVRASGQRRRMGPYTVAMAERDLMEAGRRDDVVATFFDFASQYFEYSALFVVHGDLAEGRDAHGSGASRSKVQSVGVPLDLPSTLGLVISGRESFRLARLSPQGLDGDLVKDLARRPGPLVLLVPVRVRDRAVLVLYGDHGDQDVGLEAVGDVISFTPLVAAALERVILKRKGIAPRPSLPPRSPEPARISVPPARTLSVDPPAGTDTLDHSPSPRPVLSVGPGPRVHTPAPMSLAPPRVGPRVLELAALEPAEAPPLEPSPSDLEDADLDEGSTVIAAVTGVTPPWSHAPTAIGLAASVDGGASNDAGPAENQPDGHFDRDELGTKPGVGSGATQAVSQAPEPAFVTAPTLPGADPEAAGELDWDAEPAPAFGSQPTRLVASTPPNAGFTDDTRQLLRALTAGDPHAADRLVALGPSAVPTLVAALPGPITSELRRGSGDGPPRASDCGPLLKVLVRIGPKAASMVAARASDADPAVRAWTTRLLGELPSVDAAEAISSRFLDQDIEVRRAALAAGRMLSADHRASEALSTALSNVLVDSAKADDVRHMAIEAIADLREARAVPGLIRTLENGSKEIQRSAHWALVVLTRADYGDDPEFWDAWWQENAQRHRIEWLIDALVHESQEIRRAAGDELKSTTKEYFGYYDDLSPRERERAQGRYREWWNAKGKLRFR